MAQPDEMDFTGAACGSMQPGEFYPERGTAQVTARDAKRVCNGFEDKPVCPIKERCLEYALERKERFGIWGGMSERERAKVAKDRRVAAEHQVKEAAARLERRKAAAKAGWEKRRTSAVQQEHAATAATRTKENSGKTTKGRARRAA